MRISHLDGKRVALWGWGREGRAAYRALRARLPSLPLTLFCNASEAEDAVSLGDALLIATTHVDAQALSAFDVVLPTKIPDKGRILTGISAWWFEETASLVRNHLISTDVADFPPPFRDVPELRGRSMLVHKAQRIDVECVVRGYLAGSGWADYRKTGRVAEHKLPPGLTKGARLPEPIFTPSTKEEEGHDEPIDFARTAERFGTGHWEEPVRGKRSLASRRMIVRPSVYAFFRSRKIRGVRFTPVTVL